MFNIHAPSRGKYSRAQIETLCLLHAVGPKGCGLTEVAERLGLSRTLASAGAEALGQLVGSGLLKEDEGGVALSEAGRLTLAGVR